MHNEEDKRRELCSECGVRFPGCRRSTCPWGEKGPPPPAPRPIVDTRKLDRSLEVLRNSDAARRAVRKAQVELHVTCYGTAYLITANGRSVETGEGDCQYARDRAEERARRVRLLGKSCTVFVEA